MESEYLGDKRERRRHLEGEAPGLDASRALGNTMEIDEKARCVSRLLLRRHYRAFATCRQLVWAAFRCVVYVVKYCKSLEAGPRDVGSEAKIAKQFHHVPVSQGAGVITIPLPLPLDAPTVNDGLHSETRNRFSVSTIAHSETFDGDASTCTRGGYKGRGPKHQGGKIA